MKRIISIILIIILISLVLTISYKVELQKDYFSSINHLLFKFNKNNNYKIDFISLYIKTLKQENYFKEKIIPTKLVYSDNNSPAIYIYQTHANEEYSYNKNNIYNIIPTVKTASYILSDELKKLGLNTLVERENTISILNSRKLPYKDSYKISRELMEKRSLENPNLKYFLDIHRDSVKKSITTTTINDIKYARIMFLLGLENKNYLENKKVITKLNDYINKNYPNLSRGIYEKQGKGVNGIYNQDYHKNVLLIEVGGYENTIDEVNNSLKVISETLYNYIQENDKK